MLCGTLARAPLICDPLPSARCLENRYKEKVEEANATEGWACPRCRGECNCSNCRKASTRMLLGGWVLAGLATCCTLQAGCMVGWGMLRLGARSGWLSNACPRKRRKCLHPHTRPCPLGPPHLAPLLQKAGKEATGQLAAIAKKAGFGSGGCWVSEGLLAGGHP